MIPEELKKDIAHILNNTDKKITFLVGAGMSAESGIPTYRGKEGFWKIGSTNYHPSTIATKRMFNLTSEEFWKFFLFKMSFIRKAKPNKGHLILKEIEDKLQDRFRLISQNIDGLHWKAGNSKERTFLIHGDSGYVRCSEECSHNLYPFPKEVKGKQRGENISEQEWEYLKCLECGELLRPNVLLFDEYYEERLYKSESAIDAAYESGIIFIIGTTGTTGLPQTILQVAKRHQLTIVDINIDHTAISDEMEIYNKGYYLQGKSSEVLTKLNALF